MSETLGTIQITFPTVDRSAVADLTAPVFRSAALTGGERLSVSIQTVEQEDDDA